MKLPKIIAEIGFNHEGKIDIAKKMIKAAANAGADMVKFQTFQASDIALPDSEHYALIEAGELDYDQHLILSNTAKDEGIEFLSTPFSCGAIALLEKVGVTAYKVASMDLDNHHILGKLAETKKPLYISTGMASIGEIFTTIEFLKKNESGKIHLLHCISLYPPKAEDLYLETIPYLKNVFDLPVGYSDHFIGIDACFAAAVQGAEIIETHFTLDSDTPGGDHFHSVNPALLKKLIGDIKQYQKMIGKGKNIFKKRADIDNKNIFRRGLYAATDIDKGDDIKLEDIIMCRPKNELTPNDISWILKSKLQKNIHRHEPLTLSHFLNK